MEELNWWETSLCTWNRGQPPPGAITLSFSTELVDNDTEITLTGGVATGASVIISGSVHSQTILLWARGLVVKLELAGFGWTVGAKVQVRRLRCFSPRVVGTPLFFGGRPDLPGLDMLPSEKELPIQQRLLASSPPLVGR